MKKILIAIDGLGGGGAEKVLINILKYLDKDKYQITLLLLFNEGIYLKEVPKHIKIKPLFQIKSNLLRRIIYKVFKLLSAKRIYKTFIKEDFDIEIAFLEGSTTKLVSGSTNPHSKKIAWVHTDLFNFHRTKYYYRSIKEEQTQYKKFNNIVFVSNDAKKGFEKLLNIHKNLKTIYNPIDVNEIRQKAQRDKVHYDQLTICSVGRLVKPKGFERLIRVHSMLLKKGIKHQLLLVGEGEERKSLEHLCHQLDVTSSVTLLGFQTNPYKYIQASDIYVSSSRAEGLPLVVAEALILGKPVISTRCSGPVELLDNGKYGLVVENSEEGLFEGLKLLLTNEKQRKKYELLSAQRESFFNIKEIMRQIEALLD